MGPDTVKLERTPIINELGIYGTFFRYVSERGRGGEGEGSDVTGKGKKQNEGRKKKGREEGRERERGREGGGRGGMKEKWSVGEGGRRRERLRKEEV